jgi:hypothetical protein
MYQVGKSEVDLMNKLKLRFFAKWLIGNFDAKEHIMKTVSFLKLTIILFVGSAFTASAASLPYRGFEPNGGGKSVLLLSGTKQEKYLVVEKGTALGFDVVGPTTVKIRTRAEFKSNASKIAYEGQVWEGEHLLVDRKVNASISKLTLPGQNVGIYNARDLIFKVPTGKHTYRLWIISDKIERFYTRFFSTGK